MAVDGWIYTTIGEQATLQRGFDITKTQQKPGNVPVVSSGGISSYHDKVAVEGPGVILGRKGVVGSVYYLPVDFWPHDTTLWVKNFHGNHPRFVYYFFKHLAPQLASMDVGSANPTLNRNHIHPIRVLWPQAKEQKAIACILGSLDDKIELNRQMNQSLDAIARAIFKSWFVNFDPIRAKAAGQHPIALAPHIADLFPDAFVDSDLGEIPYGWGIRPIGDVVQVLGGGTPSTKEPEYWEDGIHPFCTPKDMSSLTTPVLLETERHLTNEGLAKVSSGQLPGGTVLLSSRAPIGYIAIAETPVSVNQGIIAMVCQQRLPNLYVLYWVQANMERIIANANGSTFLEISKRNFRPIKAVVPPKPILEQFHEIVEPIYQRIVSNLRQTSALSALRDALLPRLISGEIQVPLRDY